MSTAPTLPQHSTEAERSVIGALLLDPDAIYEISDQLNAEDFFDPVYRDIYAAVVELSESGTIADFVTVSDALKTNQKIAGIGGSAFLAELPTDVPTSSNITTYAKLIIEKSRRRKLAQLGQRIMERAGDRDVTADELTEMAEQGLVDLHHGEAIGPVQLASLRNERFNHYAMLHESDDSADHYGIRTGYADLDDRLTGLAPGQLTVIAGRPGMGKTAFALDIAATVAFDQQKTVAFFSLEMSKEEIFARVLSKQLAVESWKIEKGALSDGDFDRMGPTLDRFAECPLYVDDDSNSTLSHIRSKARRHQMRHGLDLLVVDYLQLIEVKDRSANENQYQKISYISRNLKQLARELRCPVIALSQLSRACEARADKRPLLSDLRDSGSIEQDGDRILMLYRESEYNEDCENPDTTDIYIRKNRHGPKGHIELHFNRKTMSFTTSSSA